MRALDYRALQAAEFTLGDLADRCADVRQVDVQKILNVADARVGGKGCSVSHLCGIEVQKFAHGKDGGDGKHAEQQIQTAE